MILNDPSAAGSQAIPAPAAPPEIAELEYAILLDSLYRLTGYDFRDYAITMLKRRITERVRAENVSTVTGLLERALHDPQVLARLLDALTSRLSVPFADPDFFSTLRTKVVPWLRTFPSIRTWVIGSASDAYATAIILRESDLESRARIYATKPTQSAYERARSGYLPVDFASEARHLYREAGGLHDFDDYVRQESDGCRFIPELHDRIVFSKHHLPSDGSFNEFHLVIARGVFAFYGPAATYRAHRTIYQSVARLGIAAFGASSLGVSPHANAYEPLPEAEGFFRRVR